ncbi:hypothetical protein [Rhodococcus qingshengii]|uniref:hypothetical protein n=1 Tax=Rhodococcus qingshengii TaxID=334542 RepID=UPI001C5D5D12|nr:hypothetical protein [Rhodococcus qingshengii]MBW4818548.1 hypothetical protein [Rhodococcus qingshengii]
MLGVAISIAADTPSDGAVAFDKVAGLRATVEPGIASLIGRKEYRSLEKFAPSWEKAKSGVYDAISLRQPILIMGENGTGKRTLVRDALQSVHPDCEIVNIKSGAGLLEIEKRMKISVQSDSFVMLHNVEKLTHEEVGVLHLFLETASNEGRILQIAATAIEGLSGTSFHEEILPMFNRSVHVPALRHRGMDLRRISINILGEMTNRSLSTLDDSVFVNGHEVLPVGGQ